MARSLFLGALAVLLGALLIALFGGLGGGPGEGGLDVGSRAPGRADPAGPSAPAAPAELAEPRTDGAGGAGAAPAGAPAREAAAVEGPEGPETAGVVVAFVDRSTGAPVPNARATYLSSASSEHLERFDDLARIDALMEERGREAAADAEGRVRLPHASGGLTFVVGRAPGLFGSGILQAGSRGTREIPLDADRAIDVRVTEEGGAPVAGAPVVLRAHRGPRRNDELTVRTDAAGLATLPHAGAAVRRRADAERWSVTVDAPALEPPEAPVDPAALPGELALVLPPSGSLVVRVLEVDGARYEGAGTVGLGAVGEGEGRRLSAFAEGRVRAERPIEGGVARFRWVPVADELELRATRQGAAVSTTEFAPGPRRPGEEARAEVRLGADHPVLRLRAIDAGGAPLAGATLGVLVERLSTRIADEDEGTAATDADGRCLVDVAGGWLPDTRRTLTLHVGPREGPELFASVDLSRELEPGLHELGDVVLEPPPAFVRGRVVDALGKGVGGADLRLERARGSGANAKWAEVWQFRHRTDEEGRFDVRGSFEGERFRLSVGEDGYASTPVPFEPGDTVELAVTSAGSLPGFVLLDEEVPLSAPKVTIEPLDRGDGAPYLGWRDRREGLRADGSFVFGRLHPGTYRVDVRVGDDAEPVVTVHEVSVHGGADTVEPRLQGIDLRGRLGVHRFSLRPPDPGASVSGRLQYRPAGDERAPWSWHYFRERDTTVVSRHRVIDAIVGAEGYRPARLEDVRGGATVDLLAGLRVRLVLTGDARIPEPPICVKATLVDDGSGGGAVDWKAACFDGSRESWVETGGPGRKRVRWVVERRSSQAALAVSPRLDPPRYVEVLEGVEDQVVEVPLSQEEMDRLVEAVGG